MMNLPDPHRPDISTVVFYKTPMDAFGIWLVNTLGRDWRRQSRSAKSMDEVLALLAISPVVNRYVPLQRRGWTLLLNNGPLGTDPGVLPYHACRQLACTVVRATLKYGKYPAAILEAYDPAAPETTMHVRRSVDVAKDGARWVFHEFGAPFAFEKISCYRSRIITKRLTREMLSDYLAALATPHRRRPCLEDFATVELRTHD